MKKYSILLGAAFGLFALASCQKEVDVNIPESDNAAKHIPFVLKADVPETRTTLDASTWEMAWENGDIIYAVTTDEKWGKPYSDDTEAATVAEFVNTDGTFSTTQEIVDGTHTFNFLYTNGTQKSWHRGASTSFSLYPNQTMDATNPTANLKSYDALAAQATVTTPAQFANVSMEHLFTLMKVTLKNRTGDAITVSKFEMTASDAVLAGVLNVTFGEHPSASVKANATTYDKVSVTITNGAIENDENMDVYFVMAPLSNYSGDITFTATDTDGRTYSKTNSVNGLSFTAGSYNTASHTLKPTAAPELGDWTLVTNASQIGVGSYVVIAASGDSEVAMSEEQNDNNRGEAAVTKVGSTLSWEDGSLVQVFQIVAGSKDGTYAFKCVNGDEAGGYIYAASSSKNYLKTQSTLDAEASWSVSFSSSSASIVAQGENTRKVLQYNSGSGIFSCYSSSSQKAVAIYTGDYETPKYKVTFTQPTDGNSFTVKVDGTSITSGSEFETGTTVTIKATAASGYVFNSWTVTGATLTSPTVAETSFVIGETDVTIEASFKSQSASHWNLVSGLTNLKAGTYIIAALNDGKYYTVPNTTISGQTFTCTEATYSETDGLTAASDAGEFVFTAVEGVDNSYYIYNTNLSKYLVATGSKTFGYVDSTSNNYGYWTFSEVSSGGFSGKFSVQHSSKTHYMRAYNNSVRCYDGQNNNGVYLFINE